MRSVKKRSGMLASHDDTAKLPKVHWEGKVSMDDVDKRLNQKDDSVIGKLVDALFKRPLTGRK